MNSPKSVVLLSKVVPYDGINHAGGEYVRRHVQALQRLGHRVAVIAPSDRRNLDALPRITPGLEVHLFGPELASFWGRARNKAWTWADSTRMPHTVRVAFRRDRAAHQLVENADLVDVQWTEMLSLVQELPHRPAALTLVAHDVLTQREERRLSALPRWRILLRHLQRVRVRRARSFEQSQLGTVDRVLTFSRKDADLLSKLAPSARVISVNPPLWDDDERSQPGPSSTVREAATVLMVAAFNRRENEMGALWFIRTIWPEIVKRERSARFLLVGARPRRALRRAAAHADGVQVVGYVDALDHYYQTASVAVVPLLTGAGVKFKSIDALLRGTPLVATEVGAEGIMTPDGTHPFAVENRPDLFANAVVSTFRSQGAQSRAHAAALWARGHYGSAEFEQSLAAVIADVLAVRAKDSSECTRET